MKNITKIWVSILGLALFAGVTAYCLPLGNIVPNANKSVIRLGGEQIEAELVTEKGDLEKGLAGRKGICEKCGMLFVFPQKGEHAFWMKGMLFPLDIMWISEGKIVHVESNVSADSKETFKPKAQADSVLEVNAGFCAKYGIKEGDAVEVGA